MFFLVIVDVQKFLVPDRLLDIVVELYLPQVVDLGLNVRESAFIFLQGLVYGCILNDALRMQTPNVLVLADFELGQVQLMEVVEPAVHGLNEAGLRVVQSVASLSLLAVLHCYSFILLLLRQNSLLGGRVCKLYVNILKKMISI